MLTRVVRQRSATTLNTYGGKVRKVKGVSARKGITKKQKIKERVKINMRKNTTKKTIFHSIE